MKIFMKLPSNRWILVKDRLKQVTIRSGRKTTRYVLVGETMKEEPVFPEKKFESLTIPSGRVNKFVIRLLDIRSPQDAIVILSPLDPENYQVEFTGINPQLIKDLINSVIE
ncbi:hypothetical protein IMZ38_03525 [Thermosphaera chiliense]|uniref:Uncharacterized protein n=1 Tax=Thermosphaera chiliense TaxID=3402707 RepID=A0A7M1US10_9CREN|nr:hypothetical protein [Thermosphaera aggregans]QOR94981.1 hypothetical protein IMZ38_03525 [Thermosphaera aggregans]